jgi:hypothetical protein
MIELGEIDFINAQISPALSTRPCSFQTWRKEINRKIPINDKIVPVNGILRLWRKLPNIISIDAQTLPITDALSHNELRGL